jgi:hypothetical protein
MKNNLLGFVLLFTLFIPPCFSEVIHEISLNGAIYINSTMVLSSEKPLDYWELSVSLPKEANVVGVYDEKGDITYNYDKNSGSLTLKTNNLKARIRVVEIYFSIGEWKEIGGLDFAELGLFGFENKSTYIRTKENFPYFFVPNALVEYGEDEIRAKKEGPASVRLVFGGKTTSENFFTNADIDLDEAEKYFSIIEGVTGIKTPVKFGIALLPEQEYSKEYMDWSAGTFNGMILVKETKNPNDIIATIIHEATHGVNSFALSWDKTEISWFDEGVACYVTSAVYRLMGEQKPELFGEEKQWREKNTIYTLSPMKGPKDLLDYYISGDGYMYLWSPQSEYDRDFGYAFSELFIREYLKDDGARLHKAYRKFLEIEGPVSDPFERNSLVEEILGSRFEPCLSKSLPEIKACSKSLNEMSFLIPKVEGAEFRYYVPTPVLPERSALEQDIYGQIRGLLDYILDLFRGFWMSLNL